MLKRFSVLAMLLLTAFAVACGGSDSKGPLGGGSSGGTADPKAFTTNYYTTIFGAIAGSKSAQDLANLFPPSCRDNVKIADITRGIQDEQQQVPKIKGAKIDNVDFGNAFKATKNGDGYTVTVPSSKDSKIHVDGKWLNAHDYLVSVEFEKADSPGKPEDIELTTVDGKLYAATCDDLESVAKSAETPTPTPRSGTATPTPRSGSTPAPTQRPGTATPGSGSTAILSTSDASNFGNLYLGTILGALAGTKNGQDVINLFAPDCQKQVKVADVNAGIANQAKKYPKLKGVKIDGFDFGTKIKVAKSGNGFTITAPSSNDTKVKIGSQTLNAHTWLMSVGLEEANEGDDTSDIEVVVISGKVYSSECDTLTSIAS